MHFLYILSLMSTATTLVVAMASPVSVGVEKRDENLCTTNEKYDVPYCCPPDAQNTKNTYNLIYCSDVSGNTTLTTDDDFKKFCKDQEALALCCKVGIFGISVCEEAF
ncbi:uncharacterized protein Bfra_003293 [Botrytis fragariae]|uniref:Hydrophobin n=1 Tax=Botrytis fragariae TaxID=1964551 RepID=A0A8H6EJU8_9HELO|nr:uncharacterized protein Bfra_003293 [Botrytis fragariae]KAF5874844.1 hypothetical protein Bfra_003293 [Botrytis fragariae]